ncbi:ABC transporter substrate-binding protein [Ruania halotolerans]|uniref:ABC transporter substrate-binding protein n=1 Tax=Ruania halotolerans TaxID=2897773 RepID=UPI001E5D2D1A|nr:extracellular solute-binding protein [Ruania halotolerans]UFU07610.1 extracellular solute-binding protein [Ruania halotolerans]
MRTKLALATAALTGAALALTACSGDGGSAGGDSESTTIGFFTNKAAWEPSFDDMNTASEDDGFTLDFTGYSDQAAYDAFVKQAFRTNEKPDLFTWQTGPSLGEIVEAGMVAPTTEIWEQAIADGDVEEGLAADYTFDGEQYCVPLNHVYWVMYYNKDIYAEYDLEVPTTWDQLMGNAQVLVDNGVVPFHQMNIIFEFVWFQAILLGLDPQAYDGLADGSTSYTDPSVVEAMTIWHDMQSDGYFVDPGVTTDPQTQLQTGEVAMMYFGTFLTGQLGDIDMVSNEDYGIFPMPNVNPELEERQVVVETGPLCVGAGSANEDAALEYSAWWMGDEAQSAWAESRGDLSFNPDATVADPALAEITAEVSGEGNSIHTRYLEATPVPIYTVAAEEFGAFVTNNDDPMGHLEAIQAEADAYWDEQ